MVSQATPVTPAVSAVAHEALPVAPDPDFEVRWTAWVAKGRVHEKRARRNFIVGASVAADRCRSSLSETSHVKTGSAARNEYRPSCGRLAAL